MPQRLTQLESREARSGVSRRTIVAGAAWTAPVIAATIAVPSAAASDNCPTGTFTTQFTTGQGAGNPIILQATSPDTAEIYTVRITSVLDAGTTATQNGSTFNMSQSASGWNGGWAADGSEDYIFNDFGQAGALVLNQRKTGTTSPSGTGADGQQLTFEFFDSTGRTVSPSNVQFDIFDISSGANLPAWRPHYWDAVGFSVPPTSIVSAPGGDTGMGSGTIANPFGRSVGTLSTGSGPWRDQFSFASFPSGSTMRYTQLDGRQGWHFVSISGLRFDAQVSC
ncbi:hypothetical protein C5E10_13655 [Pseudoclavibacter sp. RFBG4]|uniref:hypothetical protein n=1 Tax=Pseudoclavibacter sp. RFBG4 TaxID=2080575 RepID=UPI000CE7E2F2|nr:hypothetical protein [Pseudoclavibacter sp. RFBG4]PPG28628.1 hypothetical protein C5E10_13655 [Pseudoclavibacter sp. RFBG4]